MVCVYGLCEECRFEVPGGGECMVGPLALPEVLEAEEFYCTLCGNHCTCEE
jgi:hypothetical protein